MISKVIIVPYFGQFPEWFDLYLADFQRIMAPQGYKLLLDTDLPDFKERVRRKLGIEFLGKRGEAKIHDYRGCLGLLYEDEIKDYDYFGFVDFDVVFGDLDKFIPDSELINLDVYSTHDTYICGALSLFKNTKEVREIFKQVPNWKSFLSTPDVYGWVEKEFSRIIEWSGLKYKYDIRPQGNPFTDEPVLRKEGTSLFQQINGSWIEVGMFHFRRSKSKGWPI